MDKYYFIQFLNENSIIVKGVIEIFFLFLTQISLGLPHCLLHYYLHQYILKVVIKLRKNTLQRKRFV